MAGPVSHLPVRNESAPREDFARKSKSPHSICRIPESVKVAPTLARWGSHHGLIWSCRPGGGFARAGFRLPEWIFTAA